MPERTFYQTLMGALVVLAAAVLMIALLSPP